MWWKEAARQSGAETRDVAMRASGASDATRCGRSARAGWSVRPDARV
jgi:hypothetical protein